MKAPMVERLSLVVLALVFVGFIALLFSGTARLKHECSAKGGVLVKGLDNLVCVDKKSAL
jgi:hypothetical protein